MSSFEIGALMAAVDSTVLTVRAWDGSPKVERGAYLDSRAPLAGFSVIDAANVDEVVALLARTPCARAKGAIEIRPILFLNDEQWKSRP